MVVLLLLGFVIWQPLEEERNGSATPHPPSPQAFGPAQQRNFAVLRGPTQPVPRALRAELRQARNKTVRTLWLDTAKYLPAGDGIWVTNGRDATCIVQAHGGAVSCARRSALFRNGVALGVAELGPLADRRTRGFIVYGIVPDQIKAIEVKIGAKKRMVQVRDNSYSLRAPKPILVKRFER